MHLDRWTWPRGPWSSAARSSGAWAARAGPPARISLGRPSPPRPASDADACSRYPSRTEPAPRHGQARRDAASRVRRRVRPIRAPPSGSLPVRGRVPGVDRLPSRAPRRIPALGRPVHFSSQPGLERSRWPQLGWMFTSFPRALDSGDVAGRSNAGLPVWAWSPRAYHLTECLLHAGERRAREPVGERACSHRRARVGWPIAGRRRGGSLLSRFIRFRVESVAWVTERP